MTVLHNLISVKKNIVVFIFLYLGLFQIAFGQGWAAYEESTVIKVAGITSENQISGLNNSQKQVTRQYLDGFGRPIQKIILKASPSGKDLIQPIVYNALGQQVYNYLPYVGNDGNGDFRITALTDQTAFYTNAQDGKVATDSSPFSQILYENSPLQRILAQGSVGEGFQVNQHSKSIAYRTNLATETILVWNSDGTSTTTYPINTLSVTQFTDEQGASKLTFTDNSGRTILNRQLTNSTINGVLEKALDTYYIYNEDGSLAFIVPPKAVVAMRSSSWNVGQVGISNLVFKFVYDSRGRLIQKTVPDGAAVYLIYDPLNRPVLVQDGNMRLNNQWNYIKYDAKGRSISQGIYKDDVNIGQAVMQSYVNGQNYTANYYEQRTGTLTNYGYYTNNSFPIANKVTGNTPLQPLSYAYYDDYDLNQDGNADYTYQVQGLTGEATAASNTRGMLTAVSKTMIGSGVSANKWLYKVMFYDKQGRSIQTQGNNHTNSAGTLTDIKTTAPDFTGKSLSDKVVKVIYNTTTTVNTYYEYDNGDRLKSIDQSYNGTAKIKIAAYTYNELGQMVYKQLHSKDDGSTFLKSLDYRFNIRGQLISINNSTLTAGGNNTSGTDALFGLELLYDKVDSGPNSLNNTPYFNGLLSAVKWKAASSTLAERCYKYTYDDQNRLKDAIYADRASGQGTWVNAGAYDEKGISYDHNGNILTLQRTAIISGSIQQIDNLQYSYNGNKLNTVSDGTGANYTALGFKNLTGSTGSYGYDVNGNMTADPYKGLSINYNVLNRTDKITITTSPGRYINYTYDASGQLLKKQQYDGGALSKTTDYIEGVVYENNTLAYLNMPEGRAVNVGSELRPEYFITDQQGNVRISFQAFVESGLYRTKQENSYYPFGLIMPNSVMAVPSQANRKLYNGGSEWQNDYGNLPDLYQTFYRNYDAALGRFISIDPKAENSHSLTPYHYAVNNPLMFNDPLGDDAEGPVVDFWARAYKALMQAESGGVADLRDGVRPYKSQNDAVAGTAERIDRGYLRGGWGATVAGSWQAYYNNYITGRDADAPSNMANGNSVPLRDVTITEAKTNSLWLTERLEESNAANQGGMTHDQELAKYGQLSWVLTYSAGISAGAAGASTELGTVITDKGWAQNYMTVYHSPGFSPPFFGTGFLIINPTSKKYLPTFQDWNGLSKGASGSFAFISVSGGIGQTYSVWGFGVSASPASLNFMKGANGTGTLNVGITTLLGAPY